MPLWGSTEDGTQEKEEWEAEEMGRAPTRTPGQSGRHELPPTQCSHLSRPRSSWLRVVVLQAGQDEALAKVRQQVLYLGDERVQLHTAHGGAWGCGCPQALWKRPRGCLGWAREPQTALVSESGDLA